MVQKMWKTFEIWFIQNKMIRVERECSSIGRAVARKVKGYPPKDLDFLQAFYIHKKKILFL
jgi:hypothetical protein